MEMKPEPMSPMNADSEIDYQMSYGSGSDMIKQEFPQSDLIGINDLLELQMPTVELNTQDLLTFDLGLDSVQMSGDSDHMVSSVASVNNKTSYNNDLSHLDFGNPFESSITDWNSYDFSLPVDLL